MVESISCKPQETGNYLDYYQDTLTQYKTKKMYTLGMHTMYVGLYTLHMQKVQMKTERKRA